jgi:hypothetical protein
MGPGAGEGLSSHPGNAIASARHGALVAFCAWAGEDCDGRWTATALLHTHGREGSGKRPRGRK